MLLTGLSWFQMPDSREDSVYLAKLAEQAERYEGQLHTAHLTRLYVAIT